MGVVTGRCVDASGAGVPGVYVYAYPSAGAKFGKAIDTHTQRDGRWWLELAPGQWQVREMGHDAHDILVAVDSIDTSPEAMAQTATEPTHDDVARLLSRRRRERAEPAPEPAADITRLMARRKQHTQPEPIEQPDPGDVGALLRERRSD